MLASAHTSAYTNRQHKTQEFDKTLFKPVMGRKLTSSLQQFAPNCNDKFILEHIFNNEYIFKDYSLETKFLCPFTSCIQPLNLFIKFCSLWSLDQSSLFFLLSCLLLCPLSLPQVDNEEILKFQIKSIKLPMLKKKSTKHIKNE